MSLVALGAESAALGNVRTVIDLVGFIVRKAQEAKSFRSECLLLANLSINLSLAFLDHEKELKDIRTKSDFQRCLRDVYLAVMECSSWKALHVGWEILVSHKLQSLKARLEEIQKHFGVELLMTITSSTGKATHELKLMRADMIELTAVTEETNKQRVLFLERIRELEIEVARFQQDARSLIPLPPVALDFVTTPSSDLEILTKATVDDVERPQSGLYKGKKVTFEKIIHKNFERLPHIVQIYQQMGSVALIQQLYAIADLQGTKYALMEDVGSFQSIEAAATTGKLSEYTELQKLRFGYEIATTVSTLHHAGVLIKSLSDTSVVIVDKGDGTIRPMMTGLSQARAVWQVSNMADQDIRFDAPEIEAAGSRSKMSDIWGLVVTLLSLITTRAPFDVRSEALDDNMHEKIRGKLKEGERPFAASSNDKSAVISTLLEYLQSNPFLRPTASSLAQRLFEFVLQKAAGFGSEDASQSQPAVPAAQELHSLAIDIMAKVEEAKKASRSKSSNEKHSIEKIDRTKFAALASAAQELDPSFSFIVGIAYLWGLVDVECKGQPLSDGKSREATCAKLAIPYLETAETLGHSGAAKELLRAHKTLAKYYKDVVELEVFD